MDYPTRNFGQINDKIKGQLANATYLGFLIIMIPMTVSSFLSMFKYGWSLNNGAILITQSLLVLGFLIRKTLSYRTRMLLIIGSTLFISLAEFSSFGMLSVGPLMLLASCIIMTLFFDKFATYTYLGFSIFYFAFVAALIANGIITYPSLNILNSFYSITSWIAHLWAYVLVGSVCVISIRKLKDNMEEAVENSYTFNEELMNAYEELTAGEEELREQYETVVRREETIRHIAFHDDLTGMPNRAAFINKIEEYIYESPDKTNLVLILVDVDDFKKINDLYGHNVGDFLLNQLGKSFKKGLTNVSMYARLSGDEFGIIAEADSFNESIEKIINKILKTFEEPFDINDIEVSASCSIGLTFYPSDASTVNELLKNADTAMYAAKRSGKNTYRVFDLEMKRAMTERYMMEVALKKDYLTDKMLPFFQPKFDAVTKKIMGFEALARWHSDEHGWVSPMVFIPLLESMALINEFGQMTLEKSLHQLKHWHEIGHSELTMAVNVSAIQFKDPKYLDVVLSILRKYDLPPTALEIEITESILIDDFDYVCDLLNKFRDTGINIGLDDFGTGYSSLTYMTKLPFTTLKIDKSFVDKMNLSGPNVVIEAIINLAHNMGFKVVAEGVETKEQAALLEVYQCDCLQGYYFSKPEPAETITKRYFA